LFRNTTSTLSTIPTICLKSHWLHVAHTIDFKHLLRTYKTVQSDVPKYLFDPTNKPIRPLRPANINLPTVVRTHVKAGDNSLAVATAISRNTASWH